MDSHTLRIYNIRTNEYRRPLFETELEQFSRDDGEVSRATFSPDGIFLALARNDNDVHVYDSRNLGRGVLYRFSHHNVNSHHNTKHMAYGSDAYGVVEANWVTGFDGKALGLISGGDDGKIPARPACVNSYMDQDAFAFGMLVWRLATPITERLLLAQTTLLTISLLATKRQARLHLLCTSMIVGLSILTNSYNHQRRFRRMVVGLRLV